LPQPFRAGGGSDLIALCAGLLANRPGVSVGCIAKLLPFERRLHPLARNHTPAVFCPP
jgi:hypothetical protein